MRLISIALALSWLWSASATALDAEGVIEARQGLMAYIGSNMRTVSGMARGQIEFNEQFVKTFGQSVSAISKALPHLFPEGSGKESGIRTEADDLIFSDVEGFPFAAAELGDAATRLSVAQSSGQLAEAVSSLGQTCSSCHSRYRSR